jgi:hypothetical protein
LKMLYTIQRAWVQDLVIAEIPSKDDYMVDDAQDISTRFEQAEIDDDERKQQFREHFRNKQVHILERNAKNE